DIAVRAGIAHGTVYRYFPNKFALATEIIGARGATGFLESLEDNSFQDPDPTKLLQTIAQKYYGNLEERLPLIRFRIAEAVSNPDLGRTYYRSLLHRLFLDLDRFVREYQKKGALKAGDSFIYGHIFYGILFTFLYCQELMLGKEITKLNLQKIIPQIVDVFLYGVATQPAKSPEK
ncbi:MAG: TetR/AcrR family transcriptional regulator, partial [Deltaproteobacteria bacterium]|nr:TetR/AcrR family transcriptional regulator [Deltaproteobacteria bacterium]